VQRGRAAILGRVWARPGLSPKGKTGEIPPLKYHYVHQLKRETAGLGRWSSTAASPESMAVSRPSWMPVSTASMPGSRGLSTGRPLLGRTGNARIFKSRVGHSRRPAEIIEHMVGYARREAGRGGAAAFDRPDTCMGSWPAAEGRAEPWRRFPCPRSPHVPDAVPGGAFFSALPILNQGFGRGKTPEPSDARVKYNLLPVGKRDRSLPSYLPTSSAAPSSMNCLGDVARPRGKWSASASR